MIFSKEIASMVDGKEKETERENGGEREVGGERRKEGGSEAI